LEPVDLAIMNPPFTSWDNMAKTYRERLNERMKHRRREYTNLLFWKISQQAHFILLADLFLKNRGVIASVLPLTTFTGRAFHPLLRFILRSYTVRYIVVCLGRAAFSEDTSLTECLFVATKKPPESPETTFKMVGLLTPPGELTSGAIEQIAQASEAGIDAPGLALVREFPQESLLPENDTLTGLLLHLFKYYDSAKRDVNDVIRHATIPLARFGELEKSLGVYVTRWVLGSEHFSYYGSKALIACREEARAIRDIDRLIYHESTSTSIRLRDRIGGHIYSFPTASAKRALRRFSFLMSPDITSQVDFVVGRPSTTLEEALTAMYGRSEARCYLARIQAVSKKYPHGRWIGRVEEGSSRMCIARRLNLAAPGTTVISCWSEEPVFLATDGYLIKGIEDQLYEKLLCLWFNSSLFLLLMLGGLTITQGSWIKIEEFNLSELPVPNYIPFTEEQKATIESLWREVSRTRWPSLMEQLADQPSRAALDEGILFLIGVTDAEERIRIGGNIRRGILSTIQALRRTMGGSGREEEDVAD